MVADSPDTAMLNTGDVATLLRCSRRHVYRLVDAGRMPAPVKLGALIRWSRASIEELALEGIPQPTATDPVAVVNELASLARRLI